MSDRVQCTGREGRGWNLLHQLCPPKFLMLVGYNVTIVQNVYNFNPDVEVYIQSLRTKLTVKKQIYCFCNITGALPHNCYCMLLYITNHSAPDDICFHCNYHHLASNCVAALRKAFNCCCTCGFDLIITQPLINRFVFSAITIIKILSERTGIHEGLQLLLWFDLINQVCILYTPRS